MVGSVVAFTFQVGRFHRDVATRVLLSEDLVKLEPHDFVTVWDIRS